MTLANDLTGRMQESIRCFTADVYRVPRLQNMQFFDDFKQDIGDLTDSIFTICSDTTDIDIGEVIVGTALTCGDAYLGWCRVIVDLDPETTQQFLGLLTG